MRSWARRADLDRRIFAFRAARKLGLQQSLEAAAERVFDIAPAETQQTPPSICLPGQFEKARIIEKDSTHEIEARRVSGGSFERPPVRAFRLRNAVLSGGVVYAGRAAKAIWPEDVQRPSTADHDVDHVAEGALAGSFLGIRYFGHWLKDDAPLSLLAEQYGEPVSPTPVSLHAKEFPETHIGGYAASLDLKWRPADEVRFGALTLFDDEDMTTHKGARIRALRERVAKKLGRAPRGRRVFIKRGVADAGVRRFRNEDEVAMRLEREGFVTLDPSKSNVSMIAETLYGADLVAGAEGSNTVHALFFMADGAGFFSITAPDRFCTVNKRWTDLIGARYGLMTADPHPDGGFVADIDDVLRSVALFG